MGCDSTYVGRGAKGAVTSAGMAPNSTPAVGVYNARMPSRWKRDRSSAASTQENAMPWPPKGKWSLPYRLLATWSFRLPDHCKSEPGVYRVIGLASDEGDPVPEPIDRVCGTDKTGTLYIGAGNLRSRIGAFVGANGPRNNDQTKPAGHTLMTPTLRKRFPLQKLAVMWLKTDSEPAAKSLEEDLIQDYQRKFGERPPMNRQEVRRQAHLRRLGLID